MYFLRLNIKFAFLNITIIGSTSAKRGRKPAASVEVQKISTDETGSLLQAEKPKAETSTKKTKDSFKGKLCHTSPVMNGSSRENKITVYLSSIKSGKIPSETSAAIDTDEIGQVAKSLALQHVFENCTGKFTYTFF